MSFIRQSKYRHVFGTPAKPEQCYTELRTDIGAADSDYIKVNSKFIVVPMRGGGGSVAVIRHDQVGKAPTDLPTISGHTGAIVDFDFNPFNDHLLATGSVDCTAKLWGIPEGGLTQSITDALVVFEGHSKKLSTVLFHPTANNVLLTSALDQHIKLWDVETGKETIDIDEKHHQNAVQSVAWNRNGSLLATTSKDKKLRVIDPRLDGNKVVQEGEGHQGTKGSRVQWLGNIDKLVTAGFSKLCERQYMVWDPRDLSKPLASQEIDVSAGQIMIFYDEDSGLLYFAGKGDGNIRYYEVVDKEPYLYLIDEYKTNVPQRGMGMLPKYAVDFMGCEMTRLYKLEGAVITPISFQVPRRNEGFQSDLYSETRAPEPALEASAWFAGENAEPKTTQFSANMTVGSGASGAAFTAKQEKKEPVKVNLPPKTNNPQELLKQNEELRKRVEDLEKALHELKLKHGEI